MVFTKYPKQGIALLASFGRAMQYPSMFQVMEPNVFMGQPMRGIVGVLCSFEDEQYSSIIYTHGVCTKYLSEGIGFLVCFGRVMYYPITCQNICYGAQCIFGIHREGHCSCIE
jgi:hypothetical protein